ncbi:MAG: thiamine-phosphate kinase [Oligoflexia bacterium]|nr:thiamine-phosphate kinase [Oligoflexia bacterium]
MPDEPDEASLIETIIDHRPARSRHRPGGHPSAQPGDDAALVSPGVVVTVDAMVQGVHWDQRSSGADVGWKLAAVNASDVAAMGCRPTWTLLTMSLASPVDGSWVEDFSRGLGQGLSCWGAQLVGGDTTASPGPTLLTLTMAGQGDHPVPRAGGRAGDLLWVTGTLGDAAAGFLDDDPAGLAWLRRPHPPVDLGAALGDAQLATAMMDISDGLLRDLPRLCRASGTGASVDAAALPAGPYLQPLSPSQRLDRQVAFGEDYQLLFSSRPESAPAVRALAAQQQLAVACIGQLTESPDVRLKGGQTWPAARFDHFPPAGTAL